MPCVIYMKNKPNNVQLISYLQVIHLTQNTYLGNWLSCLHLDNSWTISVPKIISLHSNSATHYW